MSIQTVVSIPHTGTRFLKERLEIKRHIHTWANWKRLMRNTHGRELFAPLRKPEDAWRSYARRHPVEELDVVRWIGSWYTMHALTLVREIEFIPVDRKLDTRIQDWTPVGNDDPGEYDAPLPYNFDYIYAIPFVKEYYGHDPS